MLLPTVKNISKVGLFFENALGLVRVVPEVRLSSDLIQFRDTLLLAVDVKAASVTA